MISTEHRKKSKPGTSKSEVEPADPNSSSASSTSTSTSSADEDDSYTDEQKLIHLRTWECSSLEPLLRMWGEKAGGLRWMHLHSSKWWREKDQRLNTVGILLSSVVSASSLVGAFENYIDQAYIMTFVGFVGMLNILNQSLIRFYNCSEKASLHEQAGRQFGNFQRYVTTKLSLSRLERGPPKRILDFALRENDRLYKENIEPTAHSIHAFTTHFASKIRADEFSIPDYVSDTLKITIFNQDDTYSDLTFKEDRRRSMEARWNARAHTKQPQVSASTSTSTLNVPRSEETSLRQQASLNQK